MLRTVYLIALSLIIVAILYFVTKVIEYYKEDSVSILHLVLYSPSEHYQQMYEATREYYKQFPSIRTLYYTFSPTIDSSYEIKDDILYIKGTESYLPGILQKTIKAFSYGLTLGKVDYIIRSNISTVVDMTKLIPLLKEKNVRYGGSFIHNLQWLDPAGGIYDKTYWGTKYASGTCILFSYDTLSKLLEHQDRINEFVIDDVSIGLWVNSIFPDQERTDFISYFRTIDKEDQLDTILKENQTIFYRNRHPNREDDVKQIKKIVNHLVKEVSKK